MKQANERNVVRPAVIGVIALLAAVACSRSAAAQDNSLFPRDEQTAPVGGGPTVRPASGPGTGPADGPMQAPRGVARTSMRSPRPNAVLLRRSPFAVHLPEPETIKVHDLVTIIVRISKTAKSDAKLKSKKDWTHEWALDEWIRINSDNNLVSDTFPDGAPSVKFKFKNDFKGDGKYDRQDSFTTRIQATVIDVKPNGNLVLEAKNDVEFGGERFAVTLTGTCCSRDVTPQNTVLSSQIADLTLRAKESGATRDASRRGWLQRAFDFLRPV